jgi:phage gp46-like protein
MNSTMASSTRWWVNTRYAIPVLLGGLLLAGLSFAEGIEIRWAELSLVKNAYVLNADIAVNLNENLEDALKKGLVLHFQTDFELDRPRGWWWFAESIAEASRTSILSYHLLLRRYYLETNYQLKTYDTLDEALQALGHIEGWQVAEQKQLDPRETYRGRLRLKLDVNKLPKAIQINAISGTKWQADSDWYEWKIHP